MKDQGYIQGCCFDAAADDDHEKFFVFLIYLLRGFLQPKPITKSQMTKEVIRCSVLMFILILQIKRKAPASNLLKLSHFNSPNNERKINLPKLVRSVDTAVAL
jgi:hypothetical protein